MKRWLLILLIALLPIQFGWASVGAYCGDQHESSKEHALHADVSDSGRADSLDESGADTRKAADLRLFDFDCGHHCHGHSIPLPTSALSFPLDTAGIEWLDEPAVRQLQLAPLRPERPQWHPLA